MKKFFSFLISLILLLSLGASAFAVRQGEIDEEIPAVGYEAALERAKQFVELDRDKTLVEIAEENNAIVYHYNQYGEAVPPEPLISVSKDQSWDDVVKMLFEKYSVDPERVAITYYNTVTGEEHSLNADEYFISASLFKVPLNMILSDTQSPDGISLDENIWGEPYRYYQWRTIAHSDNAAAVTLEERVGGYVAFRDKQVQYLGGNPADDLGEYASHINNWYTAHQMENALKILYAEPERFPGVMENMLIAHPYEYFRMWERRVPIAHKYGFVEETGDWSSDLYINDCGVLYADQPVIVVLMTKSVDKAYDVIGEFATLMIDYTNYRAAEYQAVEESARDNAKATFEEKDISGYAPAVELTAKQQSPEQVKEKNMSVFACLVILLILSLMVFACVFIFRRNKAGRIRARWAVPAIIIAGLAMILCVVALNVGTIAAKPTGSPQDAVIGFFDNLTGGNYTEAYSYLSDYSDLGLQNEPDTEEGRLIYDALKKSWSYSITEPCEQNKLSATQKLTFRYLDLKAVEQDAAGRVDGILNEVVQSRSSSEIYDADNKYKPEITDEVYLRALQQTLANAASYYKAADITVNLSYDGGRWLMATNPELISALLGGTN